MTWLYLEKMYVELEKHARQESFKKALDPDSKNIIKM